MAIPAENVTSSTDQVKQNDKDYNFAQMRKQLESERQARLDIERRSQELERQLASRTDSRESEDDDEPYVDSKRLNKTLASFERNMDKKIDERAEIKARTLLDEERRHMYLRENSDFNNVMSEDNVKRFAEKYPKVASAVINMPDGFERQKLVYESIKAFGVDKPEAKQPSIQDKIDANKKSPYYQPSGNSSAPYSNAGDFSEGGQKNAYDQMKALQKRLRI